MGLEMSIDPGNHDHNLHHKCVQHLKFSSYMLIYYFACAVRTLDMRSDFFANVSVYNTVY